MLALLAKALAIATIFYAPCPYDSQAAGCAYRDNNVYVNPGIPEWVKQSRIHELGHIVDYNFLANADRGTFEAIMHMQRPWVSPPNSPHEQFAEAFRLCVRSVRWPRSSGGGYHYSPTTSQHRKVCRLLDSIGAR